MSVHKLFVIGGADDEQVLLTLSDVGNSSRLVCVVRGETHSVDERDFFEALLVIRRRVLDPKGLIPFCYGASLDVWPSGMGRDVGRGLRAYKAKIGAQAKDLVGIFDSGADIIPARVEAQEAYHRDWVASLRQR